MQMVPQYPRYPNPILSTLVIQRHSLLLLNPIIKTPKRRINFRLVGLHGNMKDEVRKWPLGSEFPYVCSMN